MSHQASEYAKNLILGPNGEKISQRQKLLLMVLADYHNTHRQAAWPAVATLAHECLMDERSTRRVIAELETMGLLKRVLPISQGRGHYSEYQFVQLDTKGGSNVLLSVAENAENDLKGGGKEGRKGGRKEDKKLCNVMETNNNGRELELEQELNLSSDDSVLVLTPIEPSVIEPAFKWFCEQAGKTKAYQLTPKRRTMAEARWKELRTSNSYEETKKLFTNAIRGLLEDDFMVREGYVDWEQIFQSPEKFQRRIERYENPKENKRRIL